MTDDVIITPGEAADFRFRLGAVERKASELEGQIDVHEEKCAGRYKAILCLIMVSIAMNVPSAWPHILAMLNILH